jgi:hypothetical protein
MLPFSCNMAWIFRVDGSDFVNNSYLGCTEPPIPLSNNGELKVSAFSGLKRYYVHALIPIHFSLKPDSANVFLLKTAILMI